MQKKDTSKCERSYGGGTDTHDIRGKNKEPVAGEEQIFGLVEDNEARDHKPLKKEKIHYVLLGSGNEENNPRERLHKTN